MPDRLGKWCGAVLIWTAAMTPILAYLAPLGFALLATISGLLLAPAARLHRQDWPLAGLLAALLAWAGLSMVWSPFSPAEYEELTLAKLAILAPLGWAAWCGARRADPGLARIALLVLGIGLALLGLLLAVEAATGAGVYQALRNALGDPIRPDLAARNVGRATFTLALFWPLAAVGARGARATRWLVAPMVIGLALAAEAFGVDAPLLSIAVALAVLLIVWRWPSGAPKALGALAGGAILLIPLVFAGLRAAGVWLTLEAAAPLSWGQRMGYWSYAIDRIAEHPLRGWGLDASRTFAPHIQLHPHNGSLQLWLELGVVGAALAGAAWLLLFRRSARSTPEAGAAAAAAAASVYLLFGFVSFGLWQEWWVGLGVLAAAFAALLRPQQAASSRERPSQPST